MERDCQSNPWGSGDLDLALNMVSKCIGWKGKSISSKDRIVQLIWEPRTFDELVVLHISDWIEGGWAEVRVFPYDHC